MGEQLKCCKCEDEYLARHLNDGCPYCRITELEAKLINLGTYKALLAEAEATIKHMKSNPRTIGEMK